MTTPTPILPSYDLSRLTFQKPSPDVDGGLFYDLAHDPLPDGGTHYAQLGMDYATTGEVNGVSALGSYLAVKECAAYEQDDCRFGAAHRQARKAVH